MRRVTLVRAALTAALLSAILVATISLAAAPAGAGGPTSALLSVPGAGSTASLYYTDAEYDELAGLVGVTEPSGTFAGTASGSGHEFGPGVTVTWLIHDVEPWRVDRIYLGAKDGPWISTQIMDGSGSLWESPVLWHHPARAARLANLLDRLGLGTEASQDPAFDGVAGAPVPESVDTPAQPAAAGAAPAARVPAAADSMRLDAAWWALAGLAAGVLMTLAWTRHRSRTGTAVDEQPPAHHDSEEYAEVLAR
jgi:hypothetical protein